MKKTIILKVCTFVKKKKKMNKKKVHEEVKHFWTLGSIDGPR